MKKYIIFILILILLVSNIQALDIKKELEETSQISLSDSTKAKEKETELKLKIISEITPDVEILKYKKLEDNKEIYDFILKDTKNTLKIKEVKNINSIQFKEGKTKGFGSDILTILDADINTAFVVLEKYYKYHYVELLHAQDNINFIKTNTSYYQNDTHIWFETNHFSSWTANFPNLYFFPQFQDAMTLNLFNYLDAEGTDYIVSLIYDPYTATSQDIVYHLDTGYTIDSYTFKSTTNVNLFEASMGKSSYYGALKLFFDLLPKTTYYTAGSYTLAVQMRLYDVVDSLIGTKTFNIYYYPEFLEPEVSTLSTTSITTTGATIRGEVDYQDLRFVSNYEVAYQGTRTGVFQYRKVGSTSWITTTVGTVAHGSTFTRSLTGLESGATYEFRSGFTYYNNIPAREHVTILSHSSDFPTFTTLSDVSVQTLTADKGTESAYLKAMVNFPSSITDLGLRFKIRETGTSTYYDIPFSSYEVPTSDVIFTSSEVTCLNSGCSVSLETGKTYEYYADVVWDSGTKTQQGSLSSFTLSSGGGGTGGTIFEDYFERATIGSDWNVTATTGNTVSIVSDEVVFSDQSSSGVGYIVKYYKFKDNDMIEIKWKTSNLAQNSEVVRIEGTGGGQAVYIVTGSGKFTVLDGATTTDITGINNNQYYVIRAENIDYTAKTYDLYIDDVDKGTFDFRSNYVGSNGLYFLTGTSNAATGFTSTVDYVKFCSDNTCSIPLTEPTLETLSATTITTTSAILGGVVDFGDTSVIGGRFQHKKTSDTEWETLPVTFASLTNNTPFYYTLTGLTPNTEYDFRPQISHESLIVTGDILSFTTLDLEPPEIEIRGAVVGSTSATLRGELLSFGGYDRVYVNFAYKKLSDIDFIYQPTTEAEMTSTGVYSYSVFPLEPETEYLNCFQGYAESDLKQASISLNGYCLEFNTTDLLSPVLETKQASSVLRTSASVNYQVLDFGSYTSLICNLEYYPDIINYTLLNTNTRNVTSTTATYSEPVLNLLSNTTYRFEAVCKDNNIVVARGGLMSFTTLATSEALPVEIDLIRDSLIITNTTVFFNYSVLFDVPNAQTDFVFYLGVFDFNNNLLFQSPFINTNTSFNGNYMFEGLESDKAYIIQAYSTYGLNNISYFYESNQLYIKTLSNSKNFFGINLDFGVPQNKQNLVALVLSFALAILLFIASATTLESYLGEFKIYVAIVGFSIGVIFFTWINYLSPVWSIGLLLIGVGLIVMKVKEGLA